MLSFIARRRRVGVVVSAFLAAASFSQQVLAADQCIDEAAKQALTSCSAFPDAASFDVGAHANGPSVKMHAVKAEEKRPVETKAPVPPTAPNLRDERASRLGTRRKGLLVVEIQGLEQLFQQTPRGAADRVTIARRLAEDYVELEGAALREKTEAEIARDTARKKEPARAGVFQSEANAADAMMKSARQKAIASYALVKNDYPSYADLDAVLYYLAFEYEQGKDNDNARKNYYELIQKRPDSRFVPNAYLAFGELFFEEAQGDPSKWPLAAQAYQKVISFPPPGNKLYGYAHYKLGYVFWNQGDFAHAMSELKKVVDFGVAYSGLPGTDKLAENARRDIIQVYALVGDPARAYGFIRSISRDPQGVNVETFDRMYDLGVAYFDTGHYAEGIVVMKDLLARDRTGVRACTYQAHVTEGTMALRGSDKDAAVAELGNQIRAYKEMRASDKPADVKNACANRTAQLVTETAMAYHLEAVGSQGQRGTNDSHTKALAAALYKRALETFTREELLLFSYPRLVREDWPTAHSMKYALADLLFVDEKWPECGPAFEAVVADDPKSPDAAESAYSAALCYQKVFDAEHAHRQAHQGSRGAGGRSATAAVPPDAARLRKKPLTDAQRGMVRAFDRYVCTIRPAATDTVGKTQLCEVKYARARTYFEAQHWAEAAQAFRDIAQNPCDAESGVYAAQLYLESANILAVHGEPARHACFAEMRADVPRMEERYCKGDLLQKNADSCASLSIVAVDLARKDAEAKVARAATLTGPAQLTHFEEAGNTYFELFRDHCQAPRALGKAPTAERCDELGYNAAKAFQAARLLAKSISAREALLRYDAETNGRSALARKATFEIGQNYQAVAVYELAADWFEKYAASDPRGEKADVALTDATLLRLGLGQEDKAIVDARLFTRTFGERKPKEAAHIAFAVGAHHVEKGEWEKARTVLSREIGLIDRAASRDIEVEAHARLARASSHLPGGDPMARAEYARVRSLWKDPREAEEKIRAAYPEDSPPELEKRIRRALDAVAEATFFAAEEARKAQVEPLKFPVYRGPGTKEDVQAFVQTRVRDWYEKKMAEIGKVEAEYGKILDLKPTTFVATAPPRWGIAAGSRAGLMWGNFVDDFRRSPIPASWRNTVLEQVYTKGIDDASEPYKVKHAKPALKKCLDLSVQFQYFDESSRACEEWLAKNYKAEYHVVDELRAAPAFVNSGLTERAPPVAYKAP
jgi:TolA-binding protein